MSAREHGTYSIEVEQDCLIIDAKGTFNAETLESYRNDLADSLELLSRNYSEWHQIIILHEESIFTPEAAKILIKSNKDRKKIGLNNCAVVLINPIGRGVIISQLKNIYRTAGVKVEFFKHIDEGKNWLDSKKNDGNK